MSGICHIRKVSLSGVLGLLQRGMHMIHGVDGRPQEGFTRCKGGRSPASSGIGLASGWHRAGIGRGGHRRMSASTSASTASGAEGFIGSTAEVSRVCRGGSRCIGAEGLRIRTTGICAHW